MALIDHFLPSLAFAAMLAAEENLAGTPFETARADLERLLDQAVARVRQEKPALAEDALFAVCAFADEVILDSRWPGREAWMRRKLQETRFGTANAGLEFYERLAALTAATAPKAAAEPSESEPPAALDPDRRELLEVYVACLTLGFRGQYSDPLNQAQADRLAGDHLARLLTNSGRPEEKIFPEAYADALPPPESPRLTPILRAVVVFGLPLLAAIGAYAAYTSLLSTFVSNWLAGL